MAAESKPRVLILGGVGFIGRELVTHLAENELVSHIRVADKQMPEVAYLSERQLAVFHNEDLVEYVQCDLSRDDHVTGRAFQPDGGGIDYVVNLAGETRCGYDASVYEEKVVNIAIKCAAAAAEAGVKRFVQLSTAHVYKSQTRRAATESEELKPWTALAEASLRAEEAVKGTPGLDVVVARPAIVYGPGDVGGIMPRVVCAAAYKRMNETMKFLWSSSTKINTVHVRDVARALWLLCSEGASGEVYNLADKTDTDQGKVNSILSSIFGIKTGFHGVIISNVARVNLSGVADEANDKHLRPWLDLSKEQGIEFTPLSPYIDKELLKQNQLYVDGSAIESLGFRYEVPEMTEELVREMVEHYVALNAFPAVDKIAPAT